MAALAVMLVLSTRSRSSFPIVLGVLISYGLAPFVGALNRLRIPRALGAAVAVTLLVGGLGLGIYTLSDQAMAIVSDIPTAAQRIRDRVRSHRTNSGGALEKVQRAATEIDRAAQEAATPSAAERELAATERKNTGVQKVEVVQPPFRASDYLWSGGVGLLGFAGQFVLVLFLVYFFLVTGDLYKRKLVKIGGQHALGEEDHRPDPRRHQPADREFHARAGVHERRGRRGDRDLVVVVRRQQSIIWGLLAGIFNSIPYLGPLIVTGGLGVVSFMQFDDLLRTGYVCGVAFAITSLEGFLLTPMMMSRAAQMNPVAIFVGLLFWSWIWGIWGTVLAVPMLMMLKAICDHVEDLQPIGELLGE